MLVTWIDCVGVELRDVECAQRSCSAVDSQMRGFAGESEGRAYGKSIATHARGVYDDD